ncbi:histone-like nucleoid-structuring protein Lsr2 [Streptomyces sp. AM 2-1-1]|uniref:Lsr2 family DNA-binding protein n=1 Tax=Streptomyces sp. AM 2-1-1 TaxID=3028709 RepID=UPI0031BB1140
MNDQPPSVPRTDSVTDVRGAWGRVTAWLDRHDPEAFAALGGPGSEAAIDRAEGRMGLALPAEMRRWLLLNDIDTGRHPGGPSNCRVALGCEGVDPGGYLLLGLGDIEGLHRSRAGLEETHPSPDPDHPSWRREWVPVAAEADGLHGTFLDARTGTVGTWGEGSGPREGVYASLTAYFHEAADRLEGIAAGDRRSPGGRPRSLVSHPRPEDEPVRRWARENGHRVHDRGRVPSEIREAYERSRR